NREAVARRPQDHREGAAKAGAAMTAHLVQSSVVLAIALAAAHIPRLAARTRYAVVFAALLKFAVPSSVIPLPHAAGTIVITALGRLSPPSMPAQPPPAHLPLLLSVWAAVAFALAVRLAIRICRHSSPLLSAAGGDDECALARAARRAGLQRAVSLRRSE